MLISKIILAALIIVFLWLIQNGVYKKRGLLNIEYSRAFSTSAVYEGQEVYMIETIANNKLLPVFFVLVESSIDPSLQFQKQANLEIRHGQYHRSFFVLMPYTKITRKHKVVCTKRGHYRIDSASVNVGNLIGNIVKFKNFSFNTEITVYPKIIPVNNSVMASYSYQGDTSVKRWIIEDPFIITGVREYRQGDPLNHINWKATAHTGRIQVHNRDFTANPQVMVYLNFEINENMWEYVTEPERIEMGLSYAASIVQKSINEGIKAGFACNGRLADKPRQKVYIEPKCSKYQLFYILGTMAELSMRTYLSFDYLLKHETDRKITGMDIFILTSYVNQSIDRQINLLKRLGNTVQVILLKPGPAKDGK